MARSTEWILCEGGRELVPFLGAIFRELVVTSRLEVLKKYVEMLQRIWVSGGPGTAGLKVGLNDLSCLFQTSMIL